MNAAVNTIRQAVQREEYARARLQWDEYVRHLQRAIQTRSLAPEQMEEVRALYEWARAALLTARAHLRDRYHELEVARAYLAPRPSGSGRLDARF